MEITHERIMDFVGPAGIAAAIFAVIMLLRRAVSYESRSDSAKPSAVAITIKPKKRLYEPKLSAKKEEEFLDDLIRFMRTRDVAWGEHNSVCGPYKIWNGHNGEYATDMNISSPLRVNLSGDGADRLRDELLRIALKQAEKV